LYPAPELIPVGLVQSNPDPNNPPVIASGAEILVQEVCGDPACTPAPRSAIEVIDSSGAERPVRIEALPRNPMWSARQLWRVHPEAPLPPGRYTLHTFYMSSSANPETMAREVSYAFVVRGTAGDTSVAKFDFHAYPNTYATGTGFACKSFDTSCGPQTPPPATTQRKHLVSIIAENPQVPASEVGQFLYRMVSTDPGTDPERAPYWFMDNAFEPESVLSVQYRDPRAEYCVEMQALRVRDLAVQSLGRHCVQYELPTEPHPAPFSPCQADPTEYARAYCTDNAFLCSTKNPRAVEEEVKSACEVYWLMCAPFIGNRSPRDRPGCGMP
jgi:hypothetical protein